MEQLLLPFGPISFEEGTRMIDTHEFPWQAYDAGYSWQAIHDFYDTDALHEDWVNESNRYRAEYLEQMGGDLASSFGY